MSHPNEAPHIFVNASGMINEVDSYRSSLHENPTIEMLPNGKLDVAESHMMQPAYAPNFLDGDGEGFNMNMGPNSPLKMQNTFSLDFNQVPLMAPMNQGNSLMGGSQNMIAEGKESSPDKIFGQEDSNRPKRPMNAFLLFSTERRRILRSQDSSITTSELSKILGKEWSELSEDLKREYQEKATNIKKDFFEKNPDYAYTRKPKKPKVQPQVDKLVIAPPAFLFREKPDIKRPMNAYLLFNRESRPKLLQENPKLTTSELSREIGIRWKAMKFEERQVYVERAAQMRQEFFTTHPGHIFTRQTKQEKRELLAYKAIAPSARGRKKRDRNSVAPKHPMSAFLFYLVSNRGPVAEQNSGCPAGPIAKILSVRWKALTPEEKAPWLELAQKDKERYASELKVYQAEQAAAKERRRELGLDAVPMPIPVPKPVKPARSTAKNAKGNSRVKKTDDPSGMQGEHMSENHASSAFMGQHMMQHDSQYAPQHQMKPEAHYAIQHASQAENQYASQASGQFAQQHDGQYSMHHDSLYGAQHGAPFGNQSVAHHENQYHNPSFNLSHDGSGVPVRAYDMSQPKHQGDSSYGLDHQGRAFNMNHTESSDALHQASMGGHPASEHDAQPMLSHLNSIGLGPEEPSHPGYMHHSDSGMHHQQPFNLSYSEPSAMPHSDLHNSSFGMPHPSFNLTHSSFAMNQSTHGYHPITQSQNSHFEHPHSDMDR
ncbi:High mobility group [Entomophthora muscae]|uniref:High mobility group n=2 Tax=Entomophthora muscae TaxID=34485 RepID=A0ACC2UU00_9FUNG|nr:High mobility group [Entomophthora muscae]